MRQAVQPEGWPRGHGYAHGMVGRGRVLVTAGQIGWDPRTHELAGPDFASQAERALDNIAAILRAAGAQPDDLVRTTWFITDREAYQSASVEIGAAWRRHFGRHYPAMSVVVVAALLEPGALVEIEATAILPDS